MPEKNEGNRPEVALTNADLTDTNLTGVSSGGITSNPGALPTNWQLIQGYLIGPGANLSGGSLQATADDMVAAVPEPSSLLLLVLAIVPVLALRIPVGPLGGFFH